GRIERRVRCEHEDVAVPAALEDPRFGGRCEVAAVVAERGQLRLEHSVITGVGDIGQIESGVLERCGAGGEELPGLQGGRHRVVVKGVSDDDVEGIGPEPTELRGTVTGAQGQSGERGRSNHWRAKSSRAASMSIAVCFDPGRAASRALASAQPAAPMCTARRDPSGSSTSMARRIQSRYSKSRRCGTLSVIDDEGTPLTWST